MGVTCAVTGAEIFGPLGLREKQVLLKEPPPPWTAACRGLHPFFPLIPIPFSALSLSKLAWEPLGFSQKHLHLMYFKLNFSLRLFDGFPALSVALFKQWQSAHSNLWGYPKKSEFIMLPPPPPWPGSVCTVLPGMLLTNEGLALIHELINQRTTWKIRALLIGFRLKRPDLNSDLYPLACIFFNPYYDSD